MIHESHRRRHPETEEVKDEDDEEDGCRFFGGKTASHRASPVPAAVNPQDDVGGGHGHKKRHVS